MYLNVGVFPPFATLPTNLHSLKICYLLQFSETRTQYVAPSSVALEFRMLRGPSLVDWMGEWTKMGANLAIWAFDVEMWEGVWKESEWKAKN